MKVKVTDEGVTIPKQMLEGVQEVEVRREGDRLIVIPLGEEDPIFGLGRSPVASGVSNASVQHDRYLYDPPQRAVSSWILVTSVL